MQTFRLTSLPRPKTLSIIQFQRYLKIINISPNFQVRSTEKINRLEPNKVKCDSKNAELRKMKPCSSHNYVHKLGGAFFLCPQGIRENRENEMPMLWEWIKGARAVG
jgi:hypothetical protein